jgi:methionyl-tRNA formyltransferase
MQASPVKQWALERGLALIQPRSLRLDGKYPDDAHSAREALVAAAPEVMLVAAYGLLLPPWVLALPPRGCLNIHASLLPRWRGAAPIQRAIEAGDAHTGITIMQMDAGLDTGPMLLEARVPIAPDETAASLHDRLATLGSRLIVQALAQPDRLQPRAQGETGATYASKVEKAEAAIDWSRPADEIERRLRAFDPYPGCTFVHEGQLLKLWRARVWPGPLDATARPGQRFEAGADRWVMACGEGALELLQVQPPGGRRIAAAQWLRRSLSPPGG